MEISRRKFFSFATAGILAAVKPGLLLSPFEKKLWVPPVTMPIGIVMAWTEGVAEVSLTSGLIYRDVMIQTISGGGIVNAKFINEVRPGDFIYVTADGILTSNPAGLV